MSRIFPGTLVAIGVAGAISFPLYSVVRTNALDGQLEEAGIYRAEELTTIREELGSALESCLNADGTEHQSPDCGALREHYAAVGEELVQLVNTSEYQSLLPRREEIDQEMGGLRAIGIFSPVFFGILGIFGYLGLYLATPLNDALRKKN